MLRHATSFLAATLHGDAGVEFLQVAAGRRFAVDDPLAADEGGQHVAEAGEVRVAAVCADALEG